MAQTPQVDEQAQADQIETSNYEVIRRRLMAQGDRLAQLAASLNERRQALFGSTVMEVVGGETLRTENNCIPQDIVNLGDHLLFGYNVQVRMKAKMAVADVFSLHKFERDGTSFALRQLPDDNAENFLLESKFNHDFNELYTYYKDARLRQLRRVDGHLLSLFQIGSSLTDVRVLAWRVDAQDKVTYRDNSGEKDNKLKQSHDFKWVQTKREDHVTGKHPHISIRDKVFVETIGGDLTIKIENNTEDGKGIYREDDLVDRNQGLGDADIWYAEVGALILLKIKPYREQNYRYLIFNTITKQVDRVDAVGLSCLQLPESHGVVFPGGYALETGEVKRFEVDSTGMRIEHVQRAPNGEDVLYVFYRPSDGAYLLLSYNLIKKEVQTPLLCKGYSVFADGTLLLFRAAPEDLKPTTVHPLQIWRTPFMSDEHAASAPKDGSFLSKVGNAELVRGISDALSIRKTILNAQPTMELYASIIAATERMVDAYYWLQHEEAGGLSASVKEIGQTAKLVIEEFRKVRELREQAQRALAEAEDAQRLLLSELRYANWKEISKYVDGLDGLRKQRGRLITLRELKYMDLPRIDALEAEVIKQSDLLSKATAQFLMGESALVAYREAIGRVLSQVEAIATAKEGQQTQAEVDRIGEGLTLLTEIVGSLKIDDTRARTQILERIAEVLGQQNRARALLEGRLRILLEQEGQAEFAVQFQLFAQSVTGALGMADSPEKAEDLLARLMVQLEEMEGRFSQYDTYLARLAAKREEVFEVFESKKQQLLDERQRKAGATLEAAERMVAGIQRRAQKMASVEELNAYFAADAMVLKVRELAERLRELRDPVKADDIENRLKATRDQAIRSLRDKLEMFEEGGDNVIKLGRHRFSVQNQSIELTMVPRGGQMCLHITGSDFFEPIRDESFAATRDLWDITLISESPTVYRAEYLAACILRDAERGTNGLTIQELIKASLQDEELMRVIRAAIEQRYDEGYERGVHDADAAAILRAVLGLYHTAGLMRYAPAARALACLFWVNAPREASAGQSPQAAALLGATNLSGLRPGGAAVAARTAPAAPSAPPQPAAPASEAHSARVRGMWARRAQSLGRLMQAFNQRGAVAQLEQEVARGLRAFCEEQRLDQLAPHIDEASRYLVEELTAASPRFVLGADAAKLADALWDHLGIAGVRAALEEDLKALSGEVRACFELVESWLDAFVASRPEAADGQLDALKVEAICHLLTRGQLEREVSSARVHAALTGVLGMHPRVKEQRLDLRLDEFLSRLYTYMDQHVPRYLAYRQQQHTILERRKKALRLDELKPKVLSTFVRNQLIDEVYLPLIGANLAKQMGSVGESGRSDRMGLLLLISPPGYGKTTLMEYVASRLGLTFMKVNGPSIGHHVVSVDPAEAPNATARQEVEKINLALRMGNNVMLYLDDIQHTNPELLQKFISLCDATRRMEGVWEGETQTYDLRGKRFCVVMAGNPYTETGERFQIPDMLANRADTYNLGDILDGAQEAFSMSYLENALTSNPVLAPLANRERKDVVAFIRMARGESIPLSELSHGYSAVEGAEIVNVIQKLIKCQEVLLKVNLEYIRSASQEDAFRTEPPFKLQGSYRNMTKLAEKVVSAMNEAELEALIDDHYLGESQTLTTTAEQNLLKLAELRGKLTPEKAARWEAIKQEFMRRNMMGGRDDDPVARVAGPLAGLVQKVEGVSKSLQDGSKVAQELGDLRLTLMQIAAAQNRQSAQHTAVKPAVEEPKLADILGQLMAQQNAMMERAFGQLASALERQAQQAPIIVQAAPQAAQSVAPARPAIPAPLLGASNTRDSAENVYIDPSELNRAFGADPATGLEPGAPPTTTQPIPAIAAIAAEDKKPAEPKRLARPAQRPPHTTAAGKPAGDDK